MSSVPERIKALRSKMEEKGIDYYIVPTADFHQDEYVGEHFKARVFITGFTGSAVRAFIAMMMPASGLTEGISSRLRSSLRIPLFS